MTPAVSILLPFRDAERFLVSCLRSLRRQTFRDWELIAVDDHSVDASARIVKDSGLSARIVRNHGRGLVDALNSGLAECRAELVARMDADDIMVRGRLATQYAFMRAHPDIALAGSRVRACGISGRRYSPARSHRRFLGSGTQDQASYASPRRRWREGPVLRRY
jgi:glycosyltransferase involved in cell wall biosynthesis